MSPFDKLFSGSTAAFEISTLKSDKLGAKWLKYGNEKSTQNFSLIIKQKPYLNGNGNMDPKILVFS